MMRESREGMVWMEILVCLAALAMLSLLGMRSFNLFLERLLIHRAIESEAVEILGLGQRVQRVFDQRRNDSFAHNPGVIMEGESSTGHLSLRSMELRAVNESGNLIIWTLQNSNGQWREEFQDEDTSQKPSRYLNYDGRIHVYPDSSPGGGYPKSEQWTFPDCRSQRAQEGFAIYRFW